MESGEHRVLPSILPHERENKQFIVPNGTLLRMKVGIIIIIRENGYKMGLSWQT